MTYANFRRYLLPAVVLFASTILLAQDAVLKVKAEPRNAEVFVNGKAYEQHDGMLKMPAGEYLIGVYRYGFIPFQKKVTLKAGENPELEVKLEPQPGDVSGPWGNLEVRGVPAGYLVYLNGRLPDFYIGHVDEIKGSKVVLPPGDQHVYIVNPDGDHDVNTWHVNILANQKAIFHSDRNQVTYEKWIDGEKFHSLPRYQPQGEIIALGPVAARLVDFHLPANCDQPFPLYWQAINGYQTLLKLNGVAVGSGGATGQQVVNLTKPTTYYLEAFGPGGVSMMPVFVDVNNKVETKLYATPAKVHYHKVGDKLLESGSATLDWSASNAKFVWLQPIDPVTKEPLGPPQELSGTHGEQQIGFAPSNNDYGPVEKTLAYKIIAKNDCGDSNTNVAMVNVAGSIDPPETPIVAENLPPVLPQTATPLPLIGVLGLCFLAAGLILGLLRNRKGFSR